MKRRIGAIVFGSLLLGRLVGATALLSAGPQRVLDLNNTVVDPFKVSETTTAIVFVFVSTDCPVSNRYAPDVRELYEAFAAKGVVFWLVYPNPTDTAAAIRAHLQAFSYPPRALRDPDHALVKPLHISVTPEAAVYTRSGRLTYRGRIDDRYAGIGIERPLATRHDLREAIAATIAGRPVPEPFTQAVGCFVVDFVK